jgi:hypothetical protein
MLKRMALAGLLLIAASVPARADFEFTDIACETTTTTGTGTVNLAGALSPYLGFLAAGIDTGDTVPYHIIASDGSIETGTGTFTDATPDTLARSAEFSTDGVATALTLPAGTHNVCVGFTTSTFANADKGDITTSNGFKTWTIDADTIALTTDTTGNYVGSVADGTGVDGTAAGEGATFTPTLDLTEINTFTLGGGAATGIIFDAGATDPAIETASGSFTLDIGGTNELSLNATSLDPGADDGLALGTSSLGFADLFVAPGGTVEFNGVTTDTFTCASALCTIEGTSMKQAGTQHIWVPASAMRNHVSTSASCGDTHDSGATDYATTVCSFDTASDELADFTIALPKSWDEGTLTATFWWTSEGATTTQTVDWEIACTSYSDGNNLNPTFAAPQAANDTYAAAGFTHKSAATSAMTCDSTPASEDWTIFQIRRDVSDDTLDVDALLIGVMLKYTDNAANEN